MQEPETLPPKVRKIIAEAAERHGVSPDAFHQKAERSTSLTKARCSAIRQMRKLTDDRGEPLYSFGQIGSWTGVTRQWAHAQVHQSWKRTAST